MSKRGRPRRFAAKACPVCGEVCGLRVVATWRAGSIRTTQCRCEVCGEISRYVNAPGERGHWRRVRVLG